jgi:Protein DA1
MRTALFALFLVNINVATIAESPRLCAVCQEPLSGTFLLLSNPLLLERQPVCDSCAKLDSLCFTCGLPVKFNYLKLEDGRLLCERDASSAVLSQEEAQILFDDVKRDLRVVFSGLGTAPDKNITLSLSDRFQLEKLNSTQTAGHDRKVTLGLTHSQMRDHERFEHRIYLLSGLSRLRLAAVGAHEYTHAWLRENVAKDRQIDGDTVEGFCELVAYKLMVLRGEEREQRVIQANLYSRGQIDALLQAEADYDFYRAAKWIKYGFDDKIARTNTSRLLVLRNSPAGPAPRANESAPPEVLLLRGITGNAKRRFALINNRTLQKNEEAVIRVGNSNLVVRCLDITEDAVVVRVNHSKEPQELFLEPQ